MFSTSPTLLDKVVAWWSPKRGLSRVLARHRMRGLTEARQAYDGATVGRRASGWRVVSTDADSEVAQGGARLRDVARDMVRNNPFARRARNVIVNNAVGTGIIPSISVDGDDREELEQLLREHFDTTACDADGRHDLYGLQALVLATVIESGEALIRYRPRRAADRLPLPFQLQVLEPDYIDSTVDGVQPNGNIAVRGVEFNKRGERVAYHLFSQHPGGSAAYQTFRSHRVSAKSVLHIYRVDRPGQVRGVSWFAPVVLRLRDFADAADAHLVRMKIASCFAAFITKVSDELDTARTENPDSGYPLEELGPGLVQRLREGESVTFGTPPQVQGYSEYTKTVLREIAAGMDISYEALVGDLEGVNFSSGRMGWLEFQRAVDGWRKHMLIPQMCAPIGQWFLEAAAATTGKTYKASIDWTPPRREMIDPTKEVNAAISAIRAGLSSRDYEVRKLGHDPEELDKEIAASNKRADELGLALDSDGRRMTGNGMLQSPPQDSGSDKEEQID